MLSNERLISHAKSKKLKSSLKNPKRLRKLEFGENNKMTKEDLVKTQLLRHWLRRQKLQERKVSLKYTERSIRKRRRRLMKRHASPRNSKKSDFKDSI